MTYTVTWKPSLKQELANIWLAADDKRAVTEAADAIDKLLHVAPHSVGESRSGATRVIIIRPLAAAYEVFDDDRRVDVLAIRDVSKRK
jgi:hypothetical protein